MPGLFSFAKCYTILGKYAEWKIFCATLVFLVTCIVFIYMHGSSHLLLRHRILVIAEIHYKCLDILGVFTRGIIIWTFNSNFYQLQMAIHDFRIPCITLTLLDDQMHIRK